MSTPLMGKTLRKMPVIPPVKKPMQHFQMKFKDKANKAEHMINNSNGMPLLVEAIVLTKVRGENNKIVVTLIYPEPGKYEIADGKKAKK